MKREIYVDRQAWGRGVAVYVGLRQPDGRLGVLRTPAVDVIEEGGHYGDPLLYLDHTEAQQMMDELWRCGIRPSEGSGSAGSLAATERHLKDMQSIAKGLLKKQGVET